MSENIPEPVAGEGGKKPIGWIAAIIVVAIVAFSAGYFPFHASGSSNGKVHIQFYESLANSEAKYVNNTLIPQFEQEYPGISVTLVNVGSGQVSQDMLALEKSGKVGNIVAGQDNLEIGQLIYSKSGNVLMNLTQQSSAILPNTLIPSASKLVAYEKQVFGGVYFVPFRANVPLVFYNNTVFSNAHITTPPANYSALLQDAKTIGGKPLMIQGASTSGGHSGSSTATELYQLMVQYGGNPLYLKDHGDVQAIQELYNMTPYLSPGFTGGYWGSYHGLAVGNYSILDYQWPYIYNSLTNTPYNMSTSTLGVYAGPGGTNNSNHLLGGDVLFIPKGATNKASLEAFMNFLLSKKPQQETLLNLSWVAINNESYANLPAKYSVIDSALQSAISSGVFLRNPVPWITEWQTILDNVVFNPLMVKKTSGYSDIPTLLNNAHTQMYNYIKSNYGSQNATMYNSDSNYKPISV